MLAVDAAQPFEMFFPTDDAADAVWLKLPVEMEGVGAGNGLACGQGWIISGSSILENLGEDDLRLIMSGSSTLKNLGRNDHIWIISGSSILKNSGEGDLKWIKSGSSILKNSGGDDQIWIMSGSSTLENSGDDDPLLIKSGSSILVKACLDAMDAMGATPRSVASLCGRSQQVRATKMGRNVQPHTQR